MERWLPELAIQTLAEAATARPQFRFANKIEIGIDDLNNALGAQGHHECSGDSSILILGMVREFITNLFGGEVGWNDNGASAPPDRSGELRWLAEWVAIILSRDDGTDKVRNRRVFEDTLRKCMK